MSDEEVASASECSTVPPGVNDPCAPTTPELATRTVPSDRVTEGSGIGKWGAHQFCGIRCLGIVVKRSDTLLPIFPVAHRLRRLGGKLSAMPPRHDPDDFVTHPIEEAIWRLIVESASRTGPVSENIGNRMEELTLSSRGEANFQAPAERSSL